MGNTAMKKARNQKCTPKFVLAFTGRVGIGPGCLCVWVVLVVEKIRGQQGSKHDLLAMTTRFADQSLMASISMLFHSFFSFSSFPFLGMLGTSFLNNFSVTISINLQPLANLFFPKFICFSFSTSSSLPTPPQTIPVCPQASFDSSAANASSSSMSGKAPPSDSKSWSWAM